MTDKFESRSMEQPPAEKKDTDPYGIYRRWFETWGGTRDGGAGARVGSDEIEELWRRWFAGTAKGFQGENGNGQAAGLGPLWEQMAESFRKEAASGEARSKDPVEFFLRWYGETNEKWTQIADGLLKKEEVLETNARLQEDLARSQGELRQASEKTLKNLQMPSRSDVARVAKLVVGVENKVDKIEEAFGDFVYGGLRPATAESVGGLEERMDKLEDKMDRILAALEKD